MELAHNVLDHPPINEMRRAEGKLPANGVWFWAEGSAVALDSFWDKYHKTGAVLSAVPLCFGIARLSGLDIREVEGATGNIDTNFRKAGSGYQTDVSCTDNGYFHILFIIDRIFKRYGMSVFI